MLEGLRLHITAFPTHMVRPLDESQGPHHYKVTALGSCVKWPLFHIFKRGALATTLGVTKTHVWIIIHKFSSKIHPVLRIHPNSTICRDFHGNSISLKSWDNCIMTFSIFRIINQCYVFCDAMFCVIFCERVMGDAIGGV
jgi:hypothetical protein